MYIPPAFRDDDIESIRATIRAARLASLVTATSEGPVATPLPLFLDENEGEHGVLYEHVAKANPQWKRPPIGDALAIFSGPDAYVTPSWYATKQETEKVVPTWNYIAVHAYGPEAPSPQARATRRGRNTDSMVGTGAAASFRADLRRGMKKLLTTIGSKSPSAARSFTSKLMTDRILMTSCATKLQSSSRLICSCMIASASRMLTRSALMVLRMSLMRLSMAASISVAA